jgi:uncharacterized SAM-binding protein YcdF (DUF218 family)
MFFYSSKILWFMASPANLAAGLSILGAALLLTRWWRISRAVALIGAAVLALLGFSALPRAILRPLEDRFPIAAGDRGHVDGVIVLGGAMDTNRGQIVLNDAAARMTAAAELARAHPEAKLVFSGGNAGVFDRSGPTEAQAAETMFRAIDLPAERLVLEDRSRNTHENALFTRDLVQPKPGERWILVTSAWHMPRAMGCFRAVGWDLMAYPVDFRTEGHSSDYWRPFGSLAEALHLADLGIKEWIGLIAYRLAGYTAELLPTPRVAPARA